MTFFQLIRQSLLREAALAFPGGKVLKAVMRKVKYLGRK